MKIKDEMRELYETEIQARVKHLRQQAQIKVEEVKLKQLTFLETLDTAFPMREGLPVFKSDILIWRLSPAIQAFMPKGTHAYTLEAEGWPATSLSFSIAIDAGKHSDNYISVSLPYNRSSLNSSGVLFYKERNNLERLRNLIAYFPRARSNKSGIPKDHELFEEAQQVILSHVRTEVDSIEQYMQGVVQKSEANEKDLRKRLREMLT
jgi:hypothetical protein